MNSIKMPTVSKYSASRKYLRYPLCGLSALLSYLFLLGICDIYQGKSMKIQTSVRVDEVFYKEAKEVFKQFGLSFGDAVNLFLAKVSMERGIPFGLTGLNKKDDNQEGFIASTTSDPIKVSNDVEFLSRVEANER